MPDSPNRLFKHGVGVDWNYTRPYSSASRIYSVNWEYRQISSIFTPDNTKLAEWTRKAILGQLRAGQVNRTTAKREGAKPRLERRFKDSKCYAKFKQKSNTQLTAWCSDGVTRAKSMWATPDNIATTTSDSASNDAVIYPSQCKSLHLRSYLAEIASL